MPFRVWSIYSYWLSVSKTRVSSSYRAQLQPVAFTYAHPADHQSGSLVPLCFACLNSPLFYLFGQYQLYPLWLAVIHMQVPLKKPGFDGRQCFCRYSVLVLMMVVSKVCLCVSICTTRVVFASSSLIIRPTSSSAMASMTVSSFCRLMVSKARLRSMLRE